VPLLVFFCVKKCKKGYLGVYRAGFARKYNGPGYAENAYDQKLKNAYENFKNKI